MSQPVIAASPSRLASLDVFRGFVIAAMILVTDPGSSRYKYHQLGHALWTSPTCTDMIAPAFLFMVGMAIPFSFATRLKADAGRAAIAWKVFRRTVLLFLLGMALNDLPAPHWHTLHINGILQLVARCYFFGAMLYLLLLPTSTARRASTIALVGTGILILYWMLLKLVPVPGFGTGNFGMIGNLPAYVDRTVLGVNHMGRYYSVPGYGVAFDPNGLLLTISATFSTLAGILAGMALRSRYTAMRTLAILAASGAVMMALGLALHPWTPMIKNIWTSTYALFSTGVSLLAFAFLYWLIDIRRWRRGITPFLVLGTNAILAFSLSTILSRLLASHFLQHGVRTSARQWMFDHVLRPVLPPYVASLAYAVLIVAVNIALVYPLYRRRIFLKI